MPRLMPVPGSGQRRGLTLPELLVAILLLAIVGGALTRVMVKQQQYYRDASKTAGARRELRLGAGLLPGELRSISSSGGDILTMSESEVVMRAFIGTSIICAQNDDDDISVPPRNLAKHTLTSYVTLPMVGDTVFIFNEHLERGSQDDRWEKRVITNMDLSNSDCSGAPYTDPVLDPPSSKGRRRYHLDADLPDEVTIGAVVRFTRPYRYSIYQAPSGAWYLGWQEYTSGSWSTPSPVAGPYRAFQSGDNNPSGLQFRYYDSLGTRVTNMLNQKDVARVDVFLRTDAGASAITERQGSALQDSILMRVAIRNFK